MPEISWLPVLLKLTVAFVLGASIGVERELRYKPAGLKTITLVTVSGTLLALLSLHVALLASGGSAQVDLSRLLAGVITGIGFLGAGTIIRSGGHHVEGITTAAMIWIMTSVGMAIGVGAWELALVTYGLVWVALLLDPLYGWLLPRLGITPRKETPGDETPYQ